MIRKILFILFLSLGNYFSSYSQDTVIVATYNLLRFDSDTDRNEDFLKVVNLINADIYITQELNNQGGVDNFLNNIQNYWYLLIVVLVGGQIGNYLNLKIFPTRILVLITSGLVLFVAIRMAIKLFV